MEKHLKIRISRRGGEGAEGFSRENWECHQPGDSLALKQVGKVPQCL